MDTKVNQSIYELHRSEMVTDPSDVRPFVLEEFPALKVAQAIAEGRTTPVKAPSPPRRRRQQQQQQQPPPPVVDEEEEEEKKKPLMTSRARAALENHPYKSSEMELHSAPTKAVLSHLKPIFTDVDGRKYYNESKLISKWVSHTGVAIPEEDEDRGMIYMFRQPKDVWPSRVPYPMIGDVITLPDGRTFGVSDRGRRPDLLPRQRQTGWVLLRAL